MNAQEFPELEAATTVESHLLQEGDCIAVQTNRFLFTIVANRVYGGVLLCSISREAHPHGAGVPRELSDAELAKPNPDEPVLRIGESFVARGVDAKRGRMGRIGAVSERIVAIYQLQQDDVSNDQELASIDSLQST